MKNTLLFLILIIPMLTFSQSDDFQIGIYGAPNVMYRTNEPIKDSYKPSLGYQFGVTTLVPLRSNKLYLQTGIQFSNFNEKFGGTRDTLRWGSQHDGEGGFDPLKSSGEALIAEGKASDYYIDLPIGLRYYVNDGDWRFYIQPSVDLTFYLTSRTALQLTYDDPDTPPSESVSTGGFSGIRTSNLTGNIGFGVERTISDKMSIYFQPIASLQLLDTAKYSVTSSNLYAFSGRVGINFRM